MPQIVRSYFTKKVLLIGGESAGKSTLTINLANYFNTVYLEEVGRDLSELSGTDVYMLPEDFTRILLEHKAKEMRLIEQSNKVFFEDTDCLITKFFLDFLEDAEAEKNSALADAIAQFNDYDLILFLEPDVEWVQDGDRSEVIAADRKKYSEMIKKLYTDRGFTFKTISGDYNSRFEQAVKYVTELIG
jgi:HTH-type transcriptional repressor of NAD biosynthesis genes